ncbi:murein biosynthesis integral membrane protein MurJ [Streptosporangiaceae bacterium NEAU-GS5]|nr:murein biosynthesis integral membrane protein MurJ [Streptosporangiaceae bacterium NEAU-GS5]
MTRMLRASAVMAAGTLVSRITGFARTAVLAAAIGTATLGDAYNVAYTIPFILLDLLMTGVLSSVVVPSIIRAKEREPDGGQAYEQRLMTVATVALIAVAVLGVLLARPIIELYTSNLSERGVEVASTLARYILPQLAFFGVGALAGAILNTRDRFGAPMWAPVVNNIVAICVFSAYIAVGVGGANVEKITPGDLLLLGLGTTAGIVAQAIVLVIALRRTGFRFRPRFDVRNAGLGEMGRLGAWTLAFVGVNQIGFVITTNLTTSAGVEAKAAGVAYGAGYTPYTLAFQLFQLPYGIIAVSVITAMLPRMSRSVTAGDLAAVREEFASGVRLVSVALVPASLLLMVLGPAVTVPIYAHGSNDVSDALYIGNALQIFGLALVPFSLFQLLLRVFYSFGDTRTPVVAAGINLVANVALSLVFYFALPPGYVVLGLAFSYAVTYALAAAITWNMASKRVGGLGGRGVAVALSRMYAAAIPGALVALLVLWLALKVTTMTPVSAFVILAAGGGLGLLAYGLTAHRMRVPEVNSIVGMVTSRVGR